MRANKVRVLILSSMAKYSGGEICIFRIVNGNEELTPIFALPQGEFSKLLEDHHIEVTYINELIPIKHQSVFAIIPRFLKNLYHIYAVTKQTNADVIIANGTGLGFYTGILHFFLRKKTIVIHHHPVLSSASSIRYLLHHVMVLMNSKVIAVSDAIKYSYKRWFIFQKRIVRIYNGIVPDTFNEKSSPQSLIPRNHGIVNIGLVATITPWKGHITALLAIHKLVASGTTNINFFIVGEILNMTSDELAYFKQLQEFIANNKLEGYVFFTGKIKRLSDIYTNLDIILNCSIEPEPFGTTIYEAMGFGKVVVASNLGGTPEMIKDEWNGYLFTSGDWEELAKKIETVLNQPNDSIIKNSIDFVRTHLSMDKARYAYNSLLSHL